MLWECEGRCEITDSHNCCFLCEKRFSCDAVCTKAPEDCTSRKNIQGEADAEQTQMVNFTASNLVLMRKLANLERQKKAAEEQSKEIREKLAAAMSAYGIKSVDNEVIKITFVAPSTTSRIDSALLKKKYPAVAAEVIKESTRAGYVKIEVKENA